MGSVASAAAAAGGGSRGRVSGHLRVSACNDVIRFVALCRKGVSIAIDARGIKARCLVPIRPVLRRVKPLRASLESDAE